MQRSAGRGGRVSSAAPLIGNAHKPVVCRVGPAVVGNQGRPARPSRILVIWVTAQAPIEFAVLAKLVAVESDSESGLARHRDGAILVLHRTALDHVVRQV